jgi:hypothetical protein
MTLQNRVSPDGELHAVAARGTLMGNRGGRFHRDDRTLGKRRHVSRRWIACVCEFKNRHRSVWGQSYTELFFLDEVTALSAGHRPCFECRRADAQHFQALFPFAEGVTPSADTMDLQLDRERRNGVKRVHQTAAAQPDGTCFRSESDIFALRNGHTLRWTHTGYTAAPVAIPPEIEALTPPSIIEVLRRGYMPRWHASAAGLTPPPR